MLERFVWAGFAAAIVAIFWLSGDGFTRYPCQSVDMFNAPECQPPICLRTRMCATDLTGVSE